MNTNTLELHEPSRREFLGLLARLPLVPAASLLPRPRARERVSAGRVRDVGENSNQAERAISPQVPMNDFPIAGFQYHDGPAALPELQPGTALTLRAHPDNPHDPYAVEILHGTLKLGYVPRFCNRHLSRLLQSDVPLACEIARVTTDAPPWDAIAVRVSLSQSQLLTALATRN